MANFSSTNVGEGTKAKAIKMLALAGVSVALGVQTAHAQSIAGAPHRTQLSNARLTTNDTITNTEALGVQGASSGCGGHLSIGGFRLRRGGGRAISSLETGVSAGGVDISKALCCIAWTSTPAAR